MSNLAVDPKVLVKSKWRQQYAKQNKGELIDIWPLHAVWSCVIFNILLRLFKRLSWLVNDLARRARLEGQQKDLG